MPRITVAPAILSKSKKDVSSKLRKISRYCERAQIDIMDNKFVKNKTVQPATFKTLRTKCKLEFQLMVKDPVTYIKQLEKIKQKPWMIIVHRESFRTEDDAIYVLDYLKRQKIKPGIAINPKTPVSKIKNAAKHADLILVMTVEPGFGGQKFIKRTLPKIKALRKKFPRKDIEVDGGVNEETGALAKKAGANVLVAGTSIFNAPSIKEKIKGLKK